MRQQFGSYEVELSNTDKVLFPDCGITKGEVIDYYREVSRLMLPWLRDRVVTMQRFPDGLGKEGFFQKQVPDYFPDWFTRRTVDVADGTQQVPVCDNLASLVYLANQASITQHVWLSRVERIHHPDQMVFDLDPPGEDFDTVRQAALDCLALLDELSLHAGVKTTGSRGLHVLVPLRRREDFDTVREFARDCARVLVARQPARYTLEQRKDRRGGRLYLDVQRNAYGQTAVAPFSLRAIAGAPVAAPIPREKLEDSRLHARSYTLRNIQRYWGEVGNPWRHLRRRARTLAGARKTLDALLQNQAS